MISLMLIVWVCVGVRGAVQRPDARGARVGAVRKPNACFAVACSNPTHGTEAISPDGRPAVPYVSKLKLPSSQHQQVKVHGRTAAATRHRLAHTFCSFIRDSRLTVRPLDIRLTL